MPRRSIIMQTLEENQKRFNSYAQAIEAYNADNKMRTDAYNQRAGNYNELVKAVKEGREYAIADLGIGAFGEGLRTQIGIMTPEQEAQQLAYTNWLAEQFASGRPMLSVLNDKNAPPQVDPKSIRYVDAWSEEGRAAAAKSLIKAPLTKEEVEQQRAYDEYVVQKQAEANASAEPYIYDPLGDPNAPPKPQEKWLNPGTPEHAAALAAQEEPSGMFGVIGGKDGGFQPMNVDKEKGEVKDAGRLVDTLPEAPQPLGPPGSGMAEAMSFGERNVWLNNGDGTATRYVVYNNQWVPADGLKIRIMDFNEKPPEAGVLPVEPGYKTLSNREQKELVSPTLTGAEAELAQNQNLPAKTGLANQLSTGAGSVFSGRDKDEAIQQSGILAQVLAGKL